VPFDLVFDEHLADLSKYRVLVLPDSECLSDAQLASIRRFVENGGGMVAIGQAGLYDEWRRLRVQAGLADLIDGQHPARAYEERVGHTETAGEPVRKQAGKGRSVYLPALRFDGTLPEFGNYFRVDNRFWKKPRNWQEFTDAIRWAGNGEASLQIDGPDYLVANVVAQPAQRRMMIHLVNYNARQAALADPVRVTLRSPVKGVRLYSPDLEQPQTMETRSANETVTFAAPAFRVYSIAVVSW
jgi:Beta-galactosidase trimerisation domain